MEKALGTCNGSNNGNSKGITRKDKKCMSKDLSGALKTKRKVAQFIGKIGKVDSDSGAEDEEMDTGQDLANFLFTEVKPRKSKGKKKDKMNEIEIGMQNTTFDFEAGRTGRTSDDENESVADASLHMRPFSTGISYRKLTCNSILVSIDPFKKLYLNGKAIVQVLKGAVNIYGFQITAGESKYTVFSAKGHSSLVYIQATARTSKTDSPSYDVGGTRESISFDEFHNSKGALVVLEGFENEWCEGFRHVYPEGSNFIGPSMTGIGPGRAPVPKDFMEKLGFQLVNDTKVDKIKVKMLDFPPYFDDIFGDIVGKYDCSKGRICPFGGKGVGKSTFVRWLTNRFLSYSDQGKVLFLDLDPGQTEFNPPGVLAAHICTEPILGPNFTHLKEPIRAVFLGSVNVADCVSSYLRGVIDLFEFCSGEEELQGIPWVISTMGFSRGVGVDLACEIIKVIRPTCVIQLNIDNEQRSFPFMLNRMNVTKHKIFLDKSLPSKYKEPLGDYTFLSVNSVCNRDNANSSVWGSIPKVARECTIISYFSELIGSSDDFFILSVVPLCVPLNSIAIGTINSDLSYDGIIETLNGNLVALCQMPESAFQTEGSKKFVQKACNHPNTFVGYGIVRAFDKNSEVLYILTTVHESDIICKVNVILSAGQVGLPVHFYVKGGAKAVRPYVMERNPGTSTLHGTAKKFFIPKRVVHPILKNCLL